MNDAAIVKLNIKPEEAEEFAARIKKLLADEPATIMTDSKCDECKEECDECFDALDSYNEGFDDGWHNAIESFLAICDIDANIRADLFGDVHVRPIVERKDFDDVFIDTYLDHIFEPSDVIVHKTTGQKFYVVEDKATNFDDFEAINHIWSKITVIDADFNMSEVSRFNFKHQD